VHQIVWVKMAMELVEILQTTEAGSTDRVNVKERENSQISLCL